METQEIKNIVKALKQAEKNLLKLPLDCKTEAAEKGIDILYTANVLSEIADLVDAKIPQFHVTIWETSRRQALGAWAWAYR